ncbi:ActS/PrrB/RegB family redox-sensitive histidine kinase [Pelagibacterales bacterium SAG-MED05]|nr:ActS/PrrB/RegB family redox-sensitive histidine kinase [Pelagibacterales bacterium SAG-MED05]
MNFSTLFRLRENLNLDKKTLVILRWIAIIGQLTSINLVYFYLKLDFPIVIAHMILLLGFLTNLYLQFGIRSSTIKDFYASIFLTYDLIQLTALLYLTGGISNPFSILMIIPTIVSSTFLSMGTTIILGFLTIIFLFLLTIFHYPLPGIHDQSITFPKLYLTGYFLAIIVGLVFLSYFGIRFSGESKRRSDAIIKLQQVIAKEYELESLGGQAAAAAHSLGTPLATINVVASELKKELGENNEHLKDINLLISQTKRCGEILKQISKKQIKDDEFFSKTKIEDLLNEIIVSFQETSSKKLTLDIGEDKKKFEFPRSPELIYGLRNFIGNAVKFAKSEVEIKIKSNDTDLEVSINDDGPGFPEDVKEFLGEPYIKSKSNEVNSNAGTGLGTFLGKTLLERKSARLSFSKDNKLGGASVKIFWKQVNLKSNV